MIIVVIMVKMMTMNNSNKKNKKDDDDLHTCCRLASSWRCDSYDYNTFAYIIQHDDDEK